MKRMNAVDIAKWFIWKNYVQQLENVTEGDDYEVYEGITHLKVQKLLYYGQGISLALYNEPLFNENIYAWQHGPVIKEVYAFLSSYGRDDIKFEEGWLNDVEKIERNDKFNNILNLTYDNFGGYTAWQLREKSHIPGGPWELTVKEKGMDEIIDNDVIKEYFKDYIISNG